MRASLAFQQLLYPLHPLEANLLVQHVVDAFQDSIQFIVPAFAPESCEALVVRLRKFDWRERGEHQEERRSVAMLVLPGTGCTLPHFLTT